MYALASGQTGRDSYNRTEFKVTNTHIRSQNKVCLCVFQLWKMDDEIAGESVHRTNELLQLVHEVVGIFVKGGIFKKDCTDLVRRVALLTHLFEEIRETKGTQFENLNVAASCSLSSSSLGSWEFDLAVALKAAKRLLFVVAKFHSSNAPPVSSRLLVCSFFLHFLTNQLKYFP